MIYSFQHKKTGEVLTLEMTMAEREPWLKKHRQWQQILTRINIADPMVLGIQTREQKDFNRNVLGRMKKAIPGNNLSRSRYNQNITEV